MKLTIIFSTLIASLFGSADSNGWVTLERPQKTPFEESLEEGDKSVWIIFSKSLKKEKFHVRFPSDPHYAYLTPNEMEISCLDGNTNYQLRILNASDASILGKRGEEILAHPETLMIEEKNPTSNTRDLFYFSKGKWVHERVITTPHHLYLFQTSSDDFSSDGHSQFITSFEVESKS